MIKVFLWIKSVLLIQSSTTFSVPLIQSYPRTISKYLYKIVQVFELHFALKIKLLIRDIFEVSLNTKPM